MRASLARRIRHSPHWGGVKVGCALLAAALASLALGAPPAGAADNHPFLGALAGAKPGENIEDPCGVAVDAEGHLYIAQYYQHLIEIINEGHKGFVNEAEAENGPCQLAVDSVGRLYANEWHESVLRYTPSVFPFPLATVPPFNASLTIDSGNATGVAVDPATNRVYVAHRTYVAAFEPSGAPVMEGGEPLRIGEGSSHDYNALAVSTYAGTAGRLYVADAADDTVKAFDPALDTDAPAEVIDGAATPQEGFVDLADSGLAVDEEEGHLFAVDDLEPGREHPAAVVDEFGPGGQYLGQLPHLIVHGRSAGVAVDNSARQTHGLVYVTSGDSENSVLYGFCPTHPHPEYAGKCPAAPPTHILRTAVAGAGEGTVTSAPEWISCGEVCGWEFEAGSLVSLLAAAKPHSAFAGWSVAGAPGACPGTTACHVTLAADTEVTATFVPIPQRTLSVSAGGTGEGVAYSKPAGIWCGSACSATFDQGATVALLADPAPGSRFAGWSGAGCAGTGTCQVTLGADAAVSAVFEAVIEAPRFVASTTPAAPEPAEAPPPSPTSHHHHRHHHHRIGAEGSSAAGHATALFDAQNGKTHFEPPLRADCGAKARKHGVRRHS